jgi:DNA-binding MarR family transcriptional regulator
MDVATIKGVVDRLKAKDLVTLAADPDDRRRTLIALSERGRALIPDLEAMGAAVTADTLAPLTRAEARAFRRLLEKLT